MHTESGYHVVKRGRVITRSGVVIGCAYTRPAPQPSADAETIQRVLLSRRDRFIDLLLDAIDARWPLWFAIAALVGALLAIARKSGAL